MTLNDAIALQAPWVTYWIYVMTVGVFLLPFALFIWRTTRIAALLIVIANFLSAFGVGWLYDQMGYVKLLGLPHVVLYTPLMIYLLALLRGGSLGDWPKRILMIIMVLIGISLAFDYTDVIRYFAGERMPTPGTGPISG